MKVVRGKNGLKGLSLVEYNKSESETKLTKNGPSHLGKYHKDSTNRRKEVSAKSSLTLVLQLLV